MRYAITTPRRALPAILFVLCLGLFPAACSHPEEEDPDPRTSITFENQSNTNSTYDILIDQIRYGAISPYQSMTQDVAPNVTHQLIFAFSNTGELACSPGYVTLTPGEHYTIVCDS